MLKKSEDGATRADIGTAHGVGESSVYFQIRFGRFLRYRDAHPDDRQDLGAWHHFDKLWSKTDKKATEDARFAQLIAALPPATDVPAKAPRKNAKGKIPPADAGIAAPIADAAPDIAAARRANKTAAQRIWRALAMARVQWRGDTELTAAQ